MDNKGIGKYELSAYCAVLGKEFPLRWQTQFSSSTSYGTNERGLRFLDSTTTVKKANQERKVSHASKNIKLTVLLSTKRQDISCLKTGKVSPSPRVLQQESLSCGEPVTCTFISWNRLNEFELCVGPTGTTFSFALTKNELRRESRPIEPLGWMLDWLIFIPIPMVKLLIISVTWEKLKKRLSVWIVSFLVLKKVLRTELKLEIAWVENTSR